LEVTAIGTKSKTQQTNTHAYMTPTETADIKSLRDMKATTNPTIPYQYAAARENLANSYKSPLGAATSSAVRDAAGRSAHNRMGMEQAISMANVYNDADNTNFARQAAVAGMTAPQLVQTGGSGTQSTGGLGATVQGVSSLIGAF
jgi:hypothetical protein